MDLRWHGVTYRPNVAVPEELYEDFIDRAYGQGTNLKDTLLWKDQYERGFTSPDGNGGWYAFAYDGRKYLYLGSFSEEEIIDDFPDWEDYREEMEMKADVSKPKEAIRILRELYLDVNSQREWTGKGRLIADDTDCIDWFVDYWTFVRWNEHGNQCNISEIGFSGLIDMIVNPDEVSEYLLSSECDRGTELNARLMELNRRFSGRGGRR